MRTIKSWLARNDIVFLKRHLKDVLFLSLYSALGSLILALLVVFLSAPFPSFVSYVESSGILSYLLILGGAIFARYLYMPFNRHSRWHVLLSAFSFGGIISAAYYTVALAFDPWIIQPTLHMIAGASTSDIGIITLVAIIYITAALYLIPSFVIALIVTHYVWHMKAFSLLTGGSLIGICLFSLFFPNAGRYPFTRQLIDIAGAILFAGYLALGFIMKNIQKKEEGNEK